MIGTKPEGANRVTSPATPPRINPDVPVSRVHRHEDEHGEFHVAVCTCSWASREYADRVEAERAKAVHDMEHEPEVILVRMRGGSWMLTEPSGPFGRDRP